jgi:hypothetical protein
MPMRSPRPCRASLVALALVCGAAMPSRAQPPRGPGVRDGFAALAEGYTSRQSSGPIEAAYRMFSAPDFGGICARARAGDVRRLRAATARITARVGVPMPYAALHVDALDASGNLVPRVPIAIESEQWSDVLDTRSDQIGEDNVTPRAAGTIRLRIRTICHAGGGETFVQLRTR